MSRKVIAILQTLSILFLMSLGTVLTKRTLVDVQPFTFAWMSIFIGLITLTAYTFVIKGERIPKGLGKSIWLYIIGIGICNFTISRLTRPLALKRLPVTTTSYVSNFIGFITMFMSCFILKEYPAISQILGALIAVFGLTIYFQEPLAAAEGVGVLLILIGITAVAYTNNIARKLAILTENQLSNNIVSTVALLVGGGITVLIGFAFDFPPQAISARDLIVIIYTGVFNIALGLTVWNNILRTLRSYEASILGATTIIWSALLAMLILKEKISSHQWLGMGTMILGLILVQTRIGEIESLIPMRLKLEITNVADSRDS